MTSTSSRESFIEQLRVRSTVCTVHFRYYSLESRRRLSYLWYRHPYRKISKIKRSVFPLFHDYFRTCSRSPQPTTSCRILIGIGYGKEITVSSRLRVCVKVLNLETFRVWRRIHLDPRSTESFDTINKYGLLLYIKNNLLLCLLPSQSLE